MVDISTDVSDLDNNSSTFRVYPTVTTNELTLEGIPANSGPVRIFTLNGQLVQSVDRARTRRDLITICLTDLPAGLYIVQIGRSAQKFIKQ